MCTCLLFFFCTFMPFLLSANDLLTCMLITNVLLLLLLLVITFFAGYFQIIYLRKTMASGIKFCSCSVFTVCTIYGVISLAESFVPLHQPFPQYVCSALCASLFSVFSLFRAYPVRCSGIF